MDNQIEEITKQETKVSASPLPEAPKAKLSFLKKFNKKTALIALSIIVIAVIGFLAYQYKNLLIAAKVNGTLIGRLEIINILEKASGKNVLESLITQKLIDEEAKKKGALVNAEEIDAEIKNIADQLKAQGETLDKALATQNMSLDDLKKQIITQKELEKILADEIQVADAEIETYLKDSGVTIPAGQEANYQNQAKTQLQQQKLATASQTLITSLRAQANIKYFINY
ncbi:hypothetical protein COU23_00570 [Candidatus Kuenenbacteria bacterium CG10_big_fil_rev_8_21_14_0_10_36_11]|uniref:PpiC domain-containing protein n=1 Tax=Candidatus Kuenenbacteria bacterium CG10_big_fil_rev_8_21_14_0_10_36_11 TaxID=1974618 RepID=A0A2M6WBA3_9BACT|nr:MAG: hypothetical protein COU23_00570 [Candidatus Kuenenbacteria bacterium CG10_big_fil_rev_8_21_14_0_10_36_11]